MITRKLLCLFLVVQTVLSKNCTLPNLSVGDTNITSERNFRELSRENDLFLLAVSAKWCAHCCQFEPRLEQVHQLLKQETPYKLVRADLARLNFLRKYLYDKNEMPQLYAVKSGKFYKFVDMLTPEKVLKFLRRIESPLVEINSTEELEEFLKEPPGQENYLKTVVFAFENEEDEDSILNRYTEVTMQLANWINFGTGIVTDKNLIKSVRDSGKYINYLNSMLLKKRGTSIKELDLGLPQDMYNWVLSNGIGLVEELTPYNFQIYKTIGKPILIMFLDKNNSHHYEYLNMFKKVARDFEDQVKFVWMDGSSPTNKARKKDLGLTTEILPSLAFNLNDKRIFPFDENKPLTKDSVARFVQDFLENKLVPGTKKTTQADPEFEEIYKDTPKLKLGEFEEKAFEEGKDVLLLLYSSHNNENSYTLAPYYNKVAKRFKELEFSNVAVYRLDVATEGVPSSMKLSSVPSVFFFPAFKKQPPFIQYTGEAKVLPLMFFVQKYSDIKFSLPDLPHLSPDQVEAYYEQKSQLSPDQQEKVAKANEQRTFDL